MNEIAKKNALKLLGLMRVASLICSGEEACEKAVKTQEAVLVLVSSDASKLTRKKFHDKCKFYEVEVMDVDLTMEELGRSLGQSPRSSVAILSKDLAEKFKQRFRQTTGEEYSGSY